MLQCGWTKYSYWSYILRMGQCQHRSNISVRPHSTLEWYHILAVTEARLSWSIDFRSRIYGMLGSLERTKMAVASLQRN